MEAQVKPARLQETAPQKKLSLSITSVLVFGSAGATLLAVGIVFLLGLTSTLSNTRTLLFGQSEQLINGLLKDVSQELQPIQTQVAWVEHKVRNGDIDPQDAEEWQSFVESIPAATPQVLAIGFVDTSMQGLIYRVRQGVTEVQDLSQNKKAVELMQGVTKAIKPQWLSPLLSPGGRFIDLLIWVPLFRDGEYLGAYFQTVAATALTQRARASARGTGTTPFIIYDNNWILVHPSLPGWQRQQHQRIRRAGFEKNNETLSLPKLGDLKDPVMERIWSAERAFIDRADGKSLTRITTTEINDVRYIFVTRDISEYGEKPWTIGVYFDEDRTSEVISEIFQIGFGGLIVLVLATGLAVFVGRRTVRPIHRLANAARAIQDGELDDIGELPPSTLQEINEASHSFNQMIRDLKERERIRSLFGKYVPESVAEKLLGEEGGLTPQIATATILFVDLAGFTALSEKLEPEDIVTVLNEYFSAVVDVIERHGGVITQFQGDAILAIFNVPVADPKHAAEAVAAARELHDTVENNWFGGHKLNCRVGINTGKVVAGNVGAQNRLNYTVHGDAVNLAARLEQLNKEKGSNTLISQGTVDLVSDAALFENLGSVTVPGKTNQMNIYTLAAQPGAARLASQ